MTAPDVKDRGEVLISERRSVQQGAPPAREAPEARAQPVAVGGPSGTRPLPAPADALAARLARAVAQRSSGASSPLLQRWPAERVTVHPMSVERITGKDAPTKRRIFTDLRTRHTADAHDVIEDLDANDVWGSSKSDITGTGDDYSVRIDRQNPTPTHSNIQIQTNGESVTIATVLVSDALARARPKALHHHIRAAFKASLVDGMQWEVYDR